MSNEATIPQNNGEIINIAHIIKQVMSSATDTKLAALYILTRKAIYIRIILEEMGHKRPPAPLKTDNAFSDTVCNRKIQPKRKKINGHAVPLDQRQRIPKTIQNILMTRQNKLCRLLDKSQSSNSPQKHKKTIPNTAHHIGNAATRRTTT